MKAALVLAAALACAVSAQTPQPPPEAPGKGVVRLGKVPVSNDIVKIRLPKPAEADLGNGVHLMVLEDHRAPQIQFSVIVPGAGGYYDPADEPGLAAVTAALMREGTASKSSSQISQQLEVMAASLGITASSSSPDATISGACLTDQATKLIDLAIDVVLHPTFPEDELARYRQRMQAQLSQQRANPGFLAAEMFSRAVYGSHPAARMGLTPESIARITREDLVQFHRAHYVPDGALLAIAGDVSMLQARMVLEGKLAAWKKPPVVTTVAVRDPAPIAGPGVFLVARPSSVQTNLVVGTQAVERTSPDYDALVVMNKILGGGPTGRLFIHLREEKGYTYGAASGLSTPAYRGEWQASTNVRTDVTEAALTDLLDEIRQMRDTAVSDEELADAKRSLVAQYALELESPAQLVSLAVNRWRFKLGADYYDRYAERINAVTSEQVQQVARKYLAPERLQIVAVGDPVRLTDTLKKLGPVETYDADGNRVGGSRE
ncbi:MAG TPA: pitrilysin family protein [Vicinamibacterales bacterium]|nr:pitrilysin family protein [Vicinamibacterales bacterium]